jgi:hypothetical protein
VAELDEMPAWAQNTTMSGTFPEVGDAVNRAA